MQASSVLVQFNSSSSDLTLERQLVDQVPISGRNPYNLANLDPSIVNTPGTTAAENRPYHHAYANDYDAGGGTRRANAVLLDGVPLSASYKTSYTPSMDAIEEITVSKSSVDAENGNSLGGLISLNMKSGTNALRGSAYMFGRDPSMNSISDPTIRINPGTGHVGAARHQAADVRRHGRRADQDEQDLQLHLVRAVGRPAAADDRPHGADRRGAPRRLQPVGAERPRPDDLQPVLVDARQRRPRRPQPVREQHHSRLDDRSGGAEDARRHPAAEPAGQRRQLAGQRLRRRQLLELLAARRSELHRLVQDVRALRAVQGRSLPAEPVRRRLLPAVGQQPRRHEHGRRRGVDHVEQDDAQRARQLLQHGRRVL